jgi:hypothetical protein
MELFLVFQKKYPTVPLENILVAPMQLVAVSNPFFYLFVENVFI